MVVLSIVLLSTGTAAYLIPDTDYIANWRTPKFVGTPEFDYIVFVVASFCGGGLLVEFGFGRIKFIEGNKALQRLQVPWNAFRLIFYASGGIILLAYVIWLKLLLSGGLSIHNIAAGLNGEEGASYAIRTEGETLPGVTTLVQMEMGFFIIGSILVFKFGFRHSIFRFILPMFVVFVVAYLRSKLWSERLAVMEISIPAIILCFRLASSEKWPLWQRISAAAAPLAGPPLVFVFFSIAEYSRSWLSYYSESQNSFLMFSFMRLTGYYVTALNNGAALVELMHHYSVPFHTLDWFWRFPIIKALFPYKAIANAEPWDDYHELLTRLANPEFNNPSGVFVVRLDYGYTGGLFAWCAMGAVAMLLYRSFVKGNLPGLLLYPFFFVGLLESPRILYWPLSRCFPTWVLLLFVLALALFTSQTLRKGPIVREGLIRRPKSMLNPASRDLTRL